jgi:hypothetical protein
VLAATLKGPRPAPGTRLINDLEDQDVYGVSGQQPPPIFRPERASPQVNQWLIRKRSEAQVLSGPLRSDTWSPALCRASCCSDSSSDSNRGLGAPPVTRRATPAKAARQREADPLTRQRARAID